MINVYIVVVVILGLLVYLYRPKWLFLYWIIVEPVLYPIGCILLSISDYTDLQESFVWNTVARRNLLFIVFIFEFIKNRNSNISKLENLILAFVLMSMGIFFQKMAMGGDFNDSWSLVINNASSLLSIILLLSYKELRPTLKSLKAVIVLLFCYELLWIILNLNGIYPFIAIQKGYYISELGYDKEIESNLFMGSFLRFNKLSNFLTSIYLFFYIEFGHGKTQKSYFYIISLLFFIMVFLTGAKMSIALMVLIPIIGAFLNDEKRVIIPSLIICMILVLFVSSARPNREYVGYGGIDRAISGFIDFAKGNATTTSLSTGLIDYYLTAKTFLIGDGVSLESPTAYKKAFYKSGTSHVNGRLLVSDARMAYTLVSYGVFILFLIIIYYYTTYKSIIKNVPLHNIKKVRLCFMYITILSITELGFGDAFIYPLLIICISSFYLSDQKPHAINKIYVKHDKRRMI